MKGVTFKDEARDTSHSTLQLSSSSQPLLAYCFGLVVRFLCGLRI